jgi:hypothetical protein
MSENPPSGPLHGHGATGFPSAPTPTGFHPAPSGPPAWQPAPVRGQSRGLTYVALAIAVIATGLAAAGWFRPSAPPAPAHPAAPTYSEQQISDAKARACAALDVVNRGVTQHAGTNAPEHSSSDPAMAEAQAADSRLAIIAGGWYLRDHLDPATPQAVGDAIRHLSATLLDLGANYLAGLRNDDPTQSGLITDGNSGFDHALELCK